MGFLTRMVRALGGGERRAWGEDDELLRLFAGAVRAASGVSVTPERALRVASVLACTRVLAEGIGQLPLKVNRSYDNGRIEPARDLPIYELLWRHPNEWQTSFEFRETLMYHTVLTGNGYAFVNRDGDGVPRELIPIVPSRVAAKQDANLVTTYEVTLAGGGTARLDRKAVFHLRGPSWDAVTGLDVVQQAREAIGLAIVTEESQARLHANGVSPSGIISVEGKLEEPARKRLRARLKEMHEGVANAGRVLILDQKASFNSIAMKAVDAQHLETRRMQVEEVARALRVFPQMIGYSDKTATFASAESFFIAHVIHSLGPWIERWEQAIARDLIPDAPARGGYDLVAKMSVQGLMRGDAKSRAEFYASGIVNGWLTRNEVRRYEDLPALPGLDEPLVPLNMGTQAERDAAAKAVVRTVREALIGHNGGPPLGDAELQLRVGRVLSAANEQRLVGARDSISAVLSQLEAQTKDAA